jgi:glycosyltransferase involved in cell wall biosynthesis
MACEVPCVVTDVGDCAEIVSNTGRVVAAGDMQGIAKGVLEILEMPIQQRQGLGHAAREHIQDQYDIVSVINRYQDFYERLITEQRKD